MREMRNMYRILLGKFLCIVIDLRETGSENEWEVDETGSGSCPMAGFSIISAKPSYFTTRELVLIYHCGSRM
jgi:hypothetical protein